MPANHKEIIHEPAVVKQCLGADAGLARDEVSGLNFRNELLQASNEGVL